MKRFTIHIPALSFVMLAALSLFTAYNLLVPVRTHAAEPAGEVHIGYVNRQQVFASYPGIQGILKKLQGMREDAQKDFDTNAKDLPPTDKKVYSDRLTLQEAQKENELMKPVVEKIEATIKTVTEEKRLTVIVDATTVVSGGIDITSDVIAQVKQ